MRDATRHEKVETAPGITEGGLFGPYKFIKLKSGRRMTFMDAIAGIEAAHSDMIRNVSRASKLLVQDWDLTELEWKLDHVEEWLHAVRAHLREKETEGRKRARIAALRNVEGRTPEEAELYRRKADQLEKELST